MRGRSHWLALALVCLSWPLEARALSVEVTPPVATVSGGQTAFEARVEGAVGEVELRWDFGDGERGEFTANLTSVTHQYAGPGHYSVIVVARDDSGFASSALVHTVHRPLRPGSAPSSATIVHDAAHALVCSVNADNDTVSCVDARTYAKVSEIRVYDEPTGLALAPDGRLWIVHRDDFAVGIVDLDEGKLVEGFRLPYGSQPMAILFSSDTAYVSLMAKGTVLALDAETHDVRGEVEVGPFPRGLALSHDGTTLLVTRFISGEGHAEVTRVQTADLTVEGRFELAEDTTTEDTDQKGRGLANYLFSVAISPDGQEAWVASKKDNMARGIMRDGQELTQDNTVRPLVSVLDLTNATENVAARMDLDDRNLPAHVTFSALGDYAFVSVMGSSLIEVRDVYTHQFVTAVRGTGLGHTSSVLAGSTLFVHAPLTRSVLAYDVADILSGKDLTTRQLADVKVVANDKLSAEVLRGKQVFYDSEDKRMAFEGYVSCASCHIDGYEDGRVWDFADRGEGMRNTISLLGRRGTGHGPVHWTGNFDEIQDFEGAIRDKFGGLGFMADEDYVHGTRAQPLGDLKAGLSDDLDAMAAYVTSLDTIPRSPFRNADGSITPEGERGKAIFQALDCQRCHAGVDFTDSAEGVAYDVGTLTALSGKRLDGPLSALDTPTLLGIWQTAPYLHDGSAATLRDVLTTRNEGDLHGAVSGLSATELDELIAYLQQIDQGVAPRPLPVFDDPPAEEDGEDDAGVSDGEDDAGPGPFPAASSSGGGCAVTSARSTSLVGLSVLACLAGVVRRRRGRVSLREI